MKILFLNHNIMGRGTYWRCFHLARSLAALGQQVTLVTTSGHVALRRRLEQRDGVEILTPPRLAKPGIHDGGWAPVDILYRCAWSLGRRFDMIHAFGHRPNVSLPWMLKRLLPAGGRFFADWDDWWTRGGIITSRRRWRFLDTLEATLLEERIPRMALGVTVASSCLQQRALQLGIAPERILLLPQGADTQTIAFEDWASCRKKLSFPEDIPLITFVGYAVWDVQVLLEAFARVREKFPKAMLQIIGYDKDMQMPRLIADSPHAKGIIQRGLIPTGHLSYYLGASDVQALPMQDRLDNRARLPIKIGDYAASGRAIVMQEVGDGAQMVKEHGLGVVTGLSAEEFAEGLIEMLEDRQKAFEIGRRARDFAEKHLRWEERAKSLLEFYQKKG